MPFPPPAQEELEVILKRAFGVEGGYKELNGITLNHLGYDLFQELGIAQNPMGVIVGQLWIQLEAEGKHLDCLKAIYLSLPGNFELRNWIRTYKNEMLTLVSEEDFEAARAAYEQDRLDRRVKAISKGLAQIQNTPGLDDQTRTLARKIIQKVQDLTEYKTIHDVLHGLQMGCMTELYRISEPEIRDVERKMSLRGQKQELGLACDKIANLFADENAPPSARPQRDVLVAALSQVEELLNTAQPDNPHTTEAAAGFLRSTLRQQMSLFDSKLIEASEEIPFTEFAEMMSSLPEQPRPEAGEDDQRPLGDVGNSVFNLEQRLVIRRRVHRLWQRVEATLLNIEELIGGAGRDVERGIHWQNLRDLIQEIFDLSADNDVLDMIKLEDFGVADPTDLSTIPTEDFDYIFGHIARESRTRFQRADNALLDDCEQMKKLHQPLAALVGE